MRLVLYIICTYSFFVINKVVKNDPLLQRKGLMWFLHCIIFGVLAFFQILYEVCVVEWVIDGTEDSDQQSSRLILLALIELGFNVASVILALFLFYLIDLITDLESEKEFEEPISHKKVPFFVYLASIKLLKNYLVNLTDIEGGAPATTPPHSPPDSLRDG